MQRLNLQHILIYCESYIEDHVVGFHRDMGQTKDWYNDLTPHQITQSTRLKICGFTRDTVRKIERGKKDALMSHRPQKANFLKAMGIKVWKWKE